MAEPDRTAASYMTVFRILYLQQTRTAQRTRTEVICSSTSTFWRSESCKMAERQGSDVTRFFSRPYHLCITTRSIILAEAGFSPYHFSGTPSTRAWFVVDLEKPSLVLRFCGVRENKVCSLRDVTLNNEKRQKDISFWKCSFGSAYGRCERSTRHTSASPVLPSLEEREAYNPHERSGTAILTPKMKDEYEMRNDDGG
jgi:hypothetical protein